ncbi:uncharacterized protein LOC125679311 [Ostrea edulis]|uniref:uncharacterized protein LOC125679311 n=1 Tax=Ostrea edulis TaxID=37623 RepID=UPI0020955E70|nr:uncharacterized protein LOC125679311 [Ostrea edulis]
MEADDQGETGRSVGTKCDRDNSDQQESRGKDKSKVSATQSDYAAHKGEGYDPSDPGLRPSLLEEVLAQKKLELMRSPEVMRFLQSQQAQKTERGKTQSKE